MKTWKLYHGTSKENARKILREGLKTSFLTPIFLTPRKDVAYQYAVEGARYPTSYGPKLKPKRTPVILEVTITESDIKKQKTSKRTIELRIKNLDEVVKNKIFEYEYYENIPAKRIRVVS